MSLWRPQSRAARASSRFVVGLGLAAIVGCAGPPGDAPSTQAPAADPPPPATLESVAAEHPNVLLVVLDTTRLDRLSCYGYGRETTPHLDDVAAGGVLYESCTSAGSWTLPAHASIFTGLFPRDHRTTIENMTLDARFVTLAELLGDAGYDTAGFCANAWIGSGTGLQQGFDRFFEIWRERKQDPRDVHGAALVTEGVLRWLDERSDPARPFFVFANYLEPHSPYRPPEEWAERFLREDAEPEVVREVRSWQTPREFGYMLGVPGLEIGARELEILGDLYDAEVAYQDLRFGQLIEGLASRGLLDDTVLAVVADHGEQLGEHGMLDHKMTLFRENVHVPLILRYPPSLPAGRRVRARVQSNDLFPTLLELAGFSYPTPRGAAMLPLSNEAPGRKYTFVEFGRPRVFMDAMRREWPTADVGRFDRSLRAVLGPRLKYIWASDGELRLYDLQADPRESENLAAGRPADVRRMHELLEAFHGGRDDVIWQ